MEVQFKVDGKNGLGEKQKVQHEDYEYGIIDTKFSRTN